MKFTVTVLPGAKQDIYEILEWIQQQSPQGAQTWFRRCNEVLKSLEQIAEGCGLAPESEDNEIEIRQVIFKTRRGRRYRALFTIRENEVFVMHIRGPGQDLVAPDDIEHPD